MPRALSRVVVGIDSSTQSTKVLRVDADSGEILGSSSAGHPDGTSVHPDFWWRALEVTAGLRRRPGRLGQRAAARHGRPRRRRRTGLRRAAVERRPVGRPGSPAQGPLGCGDLGARRGRRTRGVLHGDQAGLAGGGAPRRRRARRPRAAPSRLADLAPDRAPRRDRHRPERRLGGGLLPVPEERYRDDILVEAFGRVPRLPRVLGRADVAGETAWGASWGGGVRRRTAEPPWASTSGSATWPSASAPAALSSRLPASGSTTPRDRRRVRRRERSPPAAGRDHQRRPAS